MSGSEEKFLELERDKFVSCFLGMHADLLRRPKKLLKLESFFVTTLTARRKSYLQIVSVTCVSTNSIKREEARTLKNF